MGHVFLYKLLIFHSHLYKKKSQPFFPCPQTVFLFELKTFHTYVTQYIDLSYIKQFLSSKEELSNPLVLGFILIFQTVEQQ